MLKSSNQREKERPRPYFDIMADSPNAKYPEERFIMAAEQKKPLIFRRFARLSGGIGKDPITQTIDGFLKYNEDSGSPPVRCRILDGGPQNIAFKELREQFQKCPTSRRYIVEGFTSPFKHDSTLVASIETPDALKRIDLLRLVAMIADVDCRFTYLSMEGSFTKFQ